MDIIKKDGIFSGVIPLTGIESYDIAINAYNKNPQELTVYFQELKDRGLKPSSINHKKKAIKKSLLMFAEKQGKDSSFIKFQITEFFNRPDFRPVKGDVGISYDDCLTAKELTDLKLTASRKTALMIDALYQTAARVSELLAVRLSDCTPGTNGIKVFITNGKGGKSRTVYLTTALYNDIVKTFKGKIYLLETKNKTPFLRTNVFHQIKSAGENIGIYNLHPHTLRHTWATLNLEKLGIYKTSNYLGHTDISTTAKYYLHNKPTESDILNLFNGVEK